MQPLMREQGHASLDHLANAMATSRGTELADAVVEALLNNETFFFRDRAPFDLLLGGPIERLRTARAHERRLSIWCAGCSTGQEAYSLAMAFGEDRERWAGWHVDILGTDISARAIEKARSGIYSQFEVQRGLPIVQMIRWFSEAGAQQWQIAPVLRAAVRFETANLIDPPPRLGGFDVILCRNVLLYFAPPVRSKVFARLAEAVRSDGILMLGAGETVIGQTDAFVSDPQFRGLYARADSVAALEQRRARA